MTVGCRRPTLAYGGDTRVRSTRNTKNEFSSYIVTTEFKPVEGRVCVPNRHCRRPTTYIVRLVPPKDHDHCPDNDPDAFRQGGDMNTKPPTTYGRWTYHPDNRTLTHADGGSWYVDLDRARTADEMLDWVRHTARTKGWATPADLATLCDALIDLCARERF